MMDMDQGASMGRVKLLVMAFHPWHHGLAEGFFCGWSKKYQFLPRSSGQRGHGSECNHEKRPQLPSRALKDNAIIKKIAGKFPVHVWG
jgi:hypothetical protein